jgi:hypothetical protein
MQITLWYEQRRYGNEWPAKSYKATIKPGGMYNDKIELDILLRDPSSKGFAANWSSEVRGFNLVLDKADARTISQQLLEYLDSAVTTPVVMFFGDATS